MNEEDEPREALERIFEVAYEQDVISEWTFGRPRLADIFGPTKASYYEVSLHDGCEFVIEIRRKG